MRNAKKRLLFRARLNGVLPVPFQMALSYRGSGVFPTAAYQTGVRKNDLHTGRCPGNRRAEGVDNLTAKTVRLKLSNGLDRWCAQGTEG